MFPYIRIHAQCRATAGLQNRSKYLCQHSTGEQIKPAKMYG